MTYLANARSFLTIATISTLLLACNSAPVATYPSDWLAHQAQLQVLDKWEFRGRVNVRYGNESHTPTINWLQQEQDYQVDLWGTFNSGRTVIVGRPGYVTLEQSGKIFNANSPDEMILQQLGYELPVSLLSYWIKGLPDPNSDSKLQFNELNQLVAFYQAGWSIDYDRYRQYDSYTMPSTVVLTRTQDDISLRFVRLSWTIDEDSF